MSDENDPDFRARPHETPEHPEFPLRHRPGDDDRAHPRLSRLVSRPMNSGSDRSELAKVCHQSPLPPQDQTSKNRRRLAPLAAL